MGLPGAPGTTSRHKLAQALRVAKRTAREAPSALVGAFLSPAGAWPCCTRTHAALLPSRALSSLPSGRVKEINSAA